MTTKLKVGDRVKYTSGCFKDSATNPLWGGKHGKTKGTIRHTNAGSILVKWENGRENYYSEDDLELVDETVQDAINRITQ
jgi:hypothetical protein